MWNTHRSDEKTFTRSFHWRPASDALWCMHGDITLLLSLNTWRYHSLDEMAGAVWQGIVAGESLGVIVDRCAGLWGSSEAQAGEDIRLLVRELRRRSLIAPAEPPSTATAPGIRPRIGQSRRVARSPSVMRCLWRLAWVRVLLKTVGCRRTLRRIASGTPSPVNRSANRRVAITVARHVAQAAAWLPFDIACLERSVCLLWLLREIEEPATLRIGVAPFPVSAHAWIELGGSPINDSPEHVALFKALPAIDIDVL